MRSVSFFFYGGLKKKKIVVSYFYLIKINEASCFYFTVSIYCGLLEIRYIFFSRLMHICRDLKRDACG